MKRFGFPLETLQKLRRRRRESCELAFSSARMRRDRQAADLGEVERLRREAEEDWRRALPERGPVDVDDLRARRAWVSALDRRRADLTHALARAEQACEARRLELLEAARAEKVLERLRERRHEAWSLDASREEQAAFDEAGLAGRGRQEVAP